MKSRLDPRRVEVIDEAVAEILRRKRPSDRLRMGFDLWAWAHDMLMAHIRHIHPDWDQKAVRDEVARRFLRGAI